MQNVELIPSKFYFAKKIVWKKLLSCRKKMTCSLQQQYNCCCSLRKGTLVASGILCIVTVALLFAFIPIMNIVMYTSFDSFVMENSEEVYKQYVAHSEKMDSETLVPRLCYSIIYLIIVTLLAIGVSKNNNKFLLPWLIFMGIHCIIGTAAAVAIIVYITLIFENLIAKLAFTIIFFLVLLITVIWWYFFLCVWSYYKELQGEEIIARKSITKQTAV